LMVIYLIDFIAYKPVSRRIKRIMACASTERAHPRRLGIMLRRIGFLFVSLIVAIAWSTLSTVYMMRKEKEASNRNLEVMQDAVEDKANAFQTKVLLHKAPAAKPTTVLLFPYLLQTRGRPFKEPGIANAETKQIELDGIKESRYLNLSIDIYDFDSNPAVVWMGDVTGYPWNGWCDAFHEVILKARNASLERFGNGVDVTASWRPIHIVDWSDYSYPQRCPDIEKDVGAENVKYSKRAQVNKREWNATKSWVNEGEFRNFRKEEKREYFHTPLTVRTDTVEATEYVLRENHSMTLADEIERLSRSHDVIHLWPLKGHNHTTRVGMVHSKLRFRVSHVVHSIAQEHGFKGFVGVRGEASTAGRNHVKLDYIDTLLDAKIVVVCGRDEWEGHYRLMEALVSGAMVFTDHMLALPRGLENGTSLIEYHSADDLQQMIPYYIEHESERLKIAAEGRRIAMSQHRSWHRMEEIIFGEILTQCPMDNDDPDSMCPYTAHTNERIVANCSVHSRTVKAEGLLFPVRHLECA